MQPVADGVPRQLDPRVIPLERTTGWIFAATVSGLLVLVLLITWLASAFPQWLWQLLAFLWLPLTVVLAWFAQVWPERSYQHSSYLVDDLGIEIRTGVLWRSMITVPRSRVQHIDVSQGPLQRSYGLATLVIFTAGTEHSSVPLSGLAHETALAVRDSLLPRKAEDGV